MLSSVAAMEMVLGSLAGITTMAGSVLHSICTSGGALLTPVMVRVMVSSPSFSESGSVKTLKARHTPLFPNGQLDAGLPIRP